MKIIHADVATSPVVLRWLCDSPRTGYAWRTTPYIYVAPTSNNRVIMACELYCCLLPQCEALRICRSVLPIATQTCWNDSRSGARIGFLWALENSTHKVFTMYPTIFAYFDISRILRIQTAAVSYFLHMLLHNSRLSAQTLVTVKATTVDRLNNDWCLNMVSGIQQKQDSTFYQRSLKLANRPHCQLAELATNN